MSETLKKASRKLRGIPEARLMVGEDADVTTSKNWLSQKNVETRIWWNDKPIEKSLPVCDFCGWKMSGKDVKNRVMHSKISTKALEVQRLGEYREKEGEFYDQIRRGKISCEEAFQKEKEMHAHYTEGRLTSSTETYIPIACLNCNRKLGNLHVRVSAIPKATPKPPTREEYLALKKEASTLRYLHDFFGIPYEMPLEDWMKGKDQEEIIEKVKASYEELKNLPGMRHASLGIFKDMKRLEEEVKLRPSRVMAELREPGLSIVTDKFMTQVVKLHDQGLEVKEIAEKLGSRPLFVERIINHRLESREIQEKARGGEYRRLKEERIRQEERKWR